MPNDELIDTLVNRDGRMVRPEPTPMPASPSHVQVPRTGGRDMARQFGHAQPGDTPIDALLKGLLTMGVAAPRTIYDTLMDRYKPIMKAQDVNLPADPGSSYDPRLLER